MTFPATAFALAAILLAGCQQSRTTRQDEAVTAACRTEVDRVYAAQNRGDLSRRDQSDTPFSSSYVSGITTQGLGARYSRDNMVSSCLNNATGGAAPAGVIDPGTGPAFSPAFK